MRGFPYMQLFALDFFFNSTHARIQDTRKHLRWRALQQYLQLEALIIFSKLSILDVCGSHGYASGATFQQLEGRKILENTFKTLIVIVM